MMLTVLLTRLPRLPGYQVCLFTKRLVFINQSPVNKEEVSKNKVLGTVWHEEIRGRKDEDVTNAFIKALDYADFRGFESYVFCLDNCSGQNKNWTLLTALTHFVNTPTGPMSITSNTLLWVIRFCQLTVFIDQSKEK